MKAWGEITLLEQLSVFGKIRLFRAKPPLCRLRQLLEAELDKFRQKMKLQFPDGMRRPLWGRSLCCGIAVIHPVFGKLLRWQLPPSLKCWESSTNWDIALFLCFLQIKQGSSRASQEGWDVGGMFLNGNIHPPLHPSSSSPSSLSSLRG